MDYDVPIHRGDVGQHIRSQQIPLFSGDHQDLSWNVWWQKFYDNIHRYHPRVLSEGKKFEALHNLVRGEARTIVNPWYNTNLPGSYKGSIMALHAEFGDMERTRLAVGQALRELQPANRQLAGYKEFLRKALGYKLQLVAAGERQEHAAEAAFCQLKTYAPAAAYRDFMNELARSPSGPNMPSSTKFDKFLSYLNSTIETYVVGSMAELEMAPVPSSNTLTREEQLRKYNELSRREFLEEEHAVFPSTIAMNAATKPGPSGFQAAAPTGKQGTGSTSNYPQKRQFNQPWGNTARGFNHNKGRNHNQNQNQQQKGSFKGRRSFRPPNWQCPFCETNEHHYFGCAKTVQQRIQALVDKFRCLNCARKGHGHDQCRSWTCRNCRLHGKYSRHHSGCCKFEEHPDFTKFKAQRLKDFQNQPKVQAQYAHEFAAMYEAAGTLGGQDEAEEPKKAKMTPIGVTYGSGMYIQSAYLLYSVRGDEPESEEEPDSETEVEELEPTNNSD